MVQLCHGWDVPVSSEVTCVKNAGARGSWNQNDSDDDGPKSEDDATKGTDSKRAPVRDDVPRVYPRNAAKQKTAQGQRCNVPHA
jgi:hypothetical protein